MQVTRSTRMLQSRDKEIFFFCDELYDKNHSENTTFAN
jgi:hypothetical protein